eukprot:GGOE01061784.1.p1 GENE.GGOE01061784.1~~GGOE01061784.1.p1  ORF type:complete len:402 (-),score=147.68 GGOE01061784.1:201-1406(-)
MSKKLILSPTNSTNEPHSPIESFTSFSCQKCRKHLAVTSRASAESFASAARLVEDETAWMGVSPFRSVQNPLGSDWMTVTNQFLAFVSEVTQHDQPLCFECTDLLVADLEARLGASEAERNHYVNLLQELEAEEQQTAGAEKQLAKELPTLEREEEQLLQELKRIEEEQLEVRRQAELTDQQQSDLETQVEEYWRRYNSCLVDTLVVSERKMSLEQHLQMEMEELTQLNRTNILNEAFHIWFDGHFGTINNFRLGKTASEQVEWNEINAAWGHAALLLHTIARLRRVQWTKHTVVPMGSFSTVEPGRYELYGGAPVFWAASRFDKAMVGFLHCLNEVLQKERHTSQEPIPYEIQDDRIGGLTIKLAGNEPERWTRACKFLLTNLKWLVVVLSTNPPLQDGT